MSVFTTDELPVLKALGGLIFTNPFTPERLQLEETILGRKRPGEVWNMHSVTSDDISEIATLAESRAEQISRQIAGTKISRSDCEIIEPVMLYHLFEKYRFPMVKQMLEEAQSTRCEYYRAFEKDFKLFLDFPGRATPRNYEPAKTFAIFFQIHRAFYYIFDFIIGGSIAAGELRASIWQSIFTCDIHRWQRVMFDRMNQITTLIQGESGVGKEIAANIIHSNSTRGKKPLISINCAAIPENLLESELFGYSPGAFTGANKHGKAGIFETANTGTLFLDEVVEIQPNMQSKLLRVLEERKIRRIGAANDIPVDVRIVAATNQNIKKFLEEGKLRNDLYFRLNSFEINIPPLRERREDIPELLNYYVKILSTKLNRKVKGFESNLIRRLQSYDFPGNVRELRNMVERAIILSDNETLSIKDFAFMGISDMEELFLPEPEHEIFDLDEIEKRVILKALERSGYKKTEAAQLLNITRQALDRRLEKYDIDV